MDKFLESIINKEYTTAEKEFQREISGRVNSAIDSIKREISKNLLESVNKKPEKEALEEAKKVSMEERDDNDNGIEDEEEQLDEISKKTLGSYVKRASQDLGISAMKINQTRINKSKIGQLTNTNDYSADEMTVLRKAQSDMYDANSKDELKHMKRARKRENGIYKAVDKLTEDNLREASSLDENIKLDHREYFNSHGKTAKGEGSWFLSKHKSIDFNKHKEGEDYYQSKGGVETLSSAAKNASKVLNTKQLYVMP